MNINKKDFLEIKFPIFINLKLLAFFEIYYFFL